MELLARLWVGVLMPDCPHCGNLHDRVCHLEDGSIDRSYWTREERDKFWDQARRDDPTLKLSPNSSQLADRFGAYSKKEKDETS